MISINQLPNGLTVISEQMEGVESTSYSLSIPGGLMSDTPKNLGSSVILAELVARGAGPYDSRELSAAYEQIGARHSEGAGLDKFVFGGTVLADDLAEVLRLVSLQICEPHLPADEIDDIRSLLIQDIQSVLDNPGRRAGREFSSRFFPAPYSRAGTGEIEGLKATTHDILKSQWKRFFSPRGAVLSVAGKCSAVHVLEVANKQFGEWKGEQFSRPAFTHLQHFKIQHISHDAAQVQIVLGSPSVSMREPLYYAAKVALSVLSGGMFGRLFIEVREKRGLVYSVHARHSGTSEYGCLTAYAGTTPERAQETLSVMLKELSGLVGTVTESELKRAKSNLRASLIIGEETPSSRASSNATDWWLLGRLRTNEEIQTAIANVTSADIDLFSTTYPVTPSVLTLGPQIALEVKEI